MFTITNLTASSNNISILNGLNLSIPAGELHIIMGPNGSGKSTLSKVIMGHNDYEVGSGKIMLGKSNILEMSTDERSRAGVFLAFQYPLEIPGVNFGNYLRLVYNSHKSKDEQLPVFKFRKILKEKARLLDIPEKLLDRSLNVDLSGGEKKKLEILQMAILNPKLAILDETDSGLDMDALKTIFTYIDQLKQTNKKLSILIITHYQRIFDYISPDKIHIMKEGKIVSTGSNELIEKVNKNGYKGF